MRGTLRIAGHALPKAVVAGVAIIVLVIIVGMASRSSAFTNSRGAGHPGELSTGPFNVVAIIVAAFLLAFGLFVAYAVVRALPSLRFDKSPILLLVFMPLVFAGLAVFILILGKISKGGLHKSNHPLPVNPHVLHKGHHAVATAAASHFDWGPIVIIAVVAVAAAFIFGVWVWRRERRIIHEFTDEDSAQIEATGALISESIDDLLNEPDPRRAVVAAYARMEGGLAYVGYPRSSSEAPRQFVSRVFLGLAVSRRTVLRLTNLFEEARFSPHPITEAMRHEAVGTLVSIRDELAEAVKNRRITLVGTP
ncbi:MAG: DUF4129 domain-containing protein [Acidimicrobiales bacterium]